jgi:hypothetical protein
MAKIYADVFGELTVRHGVVDAEWVRRRPDDTKKMQREMLEHCKHGGMSHTLNDIHPTDRECILEAWRIDSAWHRMHPRLRTGNRRPLPGEFWPLDSDEIKEVKVTVHRRRGLEKEPIIKTD